MHGKARRQAPNSSRIGAAEPAALGDGVRHGCVAAPQAGSPPRIDDPAGMACGATKKRSSLRNVAITLRTISSRRTSSAFVHMYAKHAVCHCRVITYRRDGRLRRARDEPSPFDRPRDGARGPLDPRDVGRPGSAVASVRATRHRPGSAVASVRATRHRSFHRSAVETREDGDAAARTRNARETNLKLNGWNGYDAPESSASRQ